MLIKFGVQRDRVSAITILWSRFNDHYCFLLIPDLILICPAQCWLSGTKTHNNSSNKNNDDSPLFIKALSVFKIPLVVGNLYFYFFYFSSSWDCCFLSFDSDKDKSSLSFKSHMLLFLSVEIYQRPNTDSQIINFRGRTNESLGGGRVTFRPGPGLPHASCLFCFNHIVSQWSVFVFVFVLDSGVWFLHWCWHVRTHLGRRHRVSVPLMISPLALIF